MEPPRRRIDATEILDPAEIYQSADVGVDGAAIAIAAERLAGVAHCRPTPSRHVREHSDAQDRCARAVIRDGYNPSIARKAAAKSWAGG